MTKTSAWNIPGTIRERSAAAEGHSAFRVLRRFLSASVVQPIQRWREEQQRYAELMSLSDRTLEDIGISRSDIAAVARDTWYRSKERESGPLFIAPFGAKGGRAQDHTSTARRAA